jgi:hypothetical protein
MHNKLQDIHNSTNPHNETRKYSKELLLARSKFASEPSFSIAFILDYNNIFETSLCSLHSQPGGHILHKHLIHEDSHERLAIFQRRHCDRPPPRFVKVIRPKTRPPPSTVAASPTQGPAALARNLPSILLTNANHLTNKVELLNGLLDDSAVNLAFITETWFDDLNIEVMRRRLSDKYHALSASRNDRKEKKEGGGALVLVSKQYATKYTPIPNDFPPKSSWLAEEAPLAMDLKIVKVDVPQLPRGFTSVLAACVYIAEFCRVSTDSKGKKTTKPSPRQYGAIKELTHAISSASKASSIGNKPLIFLCGDFNGADTTYLCKTIGLHQISKIATHNKGGALDLIFTNAPKCYSTQVWPPLGLSDHNVIYSYADQPSYRSLLPTPIKKLVRSGYVGHTVHFLRCTNWSQIIRYSRLYPQLAADAFYSHLKLAEDTCQPLKPKKERVDQPWMTEEIQQKITERQALFRAGKKEQQKKLPVELGSEIPKESEILKRHKKLSDEVESDIFKRKRNYNLRKFSSNHPDYWRVVNDYRESKQSALEDPVLASALNNGFYSVWSGIAQPDLSAYTTATCQPPSSPIFTPANVLASLNELKTSSPGPDGISATLLKSARLELCDPLAQLFNDWIEIGFVPSQWHAASITPIAKVDHPTDWSDYRPISLTSNMCKVFEKVLVKFIIRKTADMWTKNNQFGFLPGRSTLDAAIKVLFDLEEAYDLGFAALAIFFDFAKAFDLVPHDLLLLKLAKVLPPWLVRWIACYLSDRSQRVSVGKINTDWKKVEAGVIQGSVLGPVLFLIFIADINECLEKLGVSFAKYADDIIAYIIGSASSTDLPQRVVEAVDSWCNNNGMRLNTSKCKVMHFKKLRNPPVIKLGSSVLESVPTYKYLGFIINNKFESKHQWKHIEPLISKNIALLKQLKSIGLAEPILINVFKSLVLSHFRYSSTVLVACTEKDTMDMQVLQNSLLRTIGIHTTDVDAKSKYGILEVSEFIMRTCLEQVSRILCTPGHALREQLLLPATIKRHSACPFRVPKTALKSAVNITLIHFRDVVYGTGRDNPLPPPRQATSPPPQPAAEQKTKGVTCTNPACAQPNRLWPRLDVHLKACIKNNPPPAPPTP